MSTFPTGSKVGTDSQLSRTLTDDTRRQILQFLLQQEQPVSVESIAQQLSSAKLDDSNELIAGDEKRKTKIELHHLHLPKLAENGLVTYNESAGTVATTNHQLYTDLQIENDLSGNEEGTPVTPTLENPIRREVLVILDSVGRPISRDELTRAIVSREADGEPVEARIPELSAKLHHIHLPKLEESGHLTYDHVEGVISPQGSTEHICKL